MAHQLGRGFGKVRGPFSRSMQLLPCRLVGCLKARASDLEAILGLVSEHVPSPNQSKFS